MSCWFKGRAQRRTVKLRDGNIAQIQFSTPTRPLGSELELPEKGKGRPRSDLDLSDDAIGVKIVAWSRDNDGEGVSYLDVDSFLAGNAQPGARMVGDGWIVAEQAVRKKSDGEGTEVEEHRFTLQVQFDPSQAFDSTALGILLANKATVLTLTETAIELPNMPARIERRKKADSDEQQLPLGDSADSNPSTGLLD